MILRIILFSFLSAFLLYVPFYYFAPYYRCLYTHVPSDELTSWDRWNFDGNTFEFQVDDFGNSLERIKPLLGELGQSDKWFADIKSAVQWLNTTIVPFQIYINYAKAKGIEKTLPDHLDLWTEDELKAMALTPNGQRLKSNILSMFFPQDTPKPHDLGHGGIQLYIAYVLMFLAISLTFLFEYLYQSFIRPSKRWVIIVVSFAASISYLISIGFNPPLLDTRLYGQGMIFIIAAVVLAFLFGQFIQFKWVKGLLIFLLFCLSLPLQWSAVGGDYAYFLAPALRTLKGFSLNHSYFQYDHLISFLAMAWMKLGWPIGYFHIILEYSYFLLLLALYFFTENLFIHRRLAVYFILTLFIAKIGNIIDPLSCPQVTPLRLDMWLPVLALVYWKGPEHWSVGLLLGFFMIFHHAFGLIYFLSYIFFMFTIKGKFRIYLFNISIILSGFLINLVFISSNKITPAMNYLKYNIMFTALDPKSFFWYVPVMISSVFLLLWKNKPQLSERYFQCGVLLIFLAIGNLLYFFGRSVDNNLLNISSSLCLILFILIDLIIYRLSKNSPGMVKRVVSVAGIFIVGMVAYFYCGKNVDRIKMQLANFPHFADSFKEDNSFKLNFKILRKITKNNPNIIFLSVKHDFELYFEGGYTPPDFSPFETQSFKPALIANLNDRLSKGVDVIVPSIDRESLSEIIPSLKAQYMYSSKDFTLISNNKPSI